MKPTKKIIAEVTAKAIEKNFSVEKAINMLMAADRKDYDRRGVEAAEWVVQNAIDIDSPFFDHVSISGLKHSNQNYVSRMRNSF